jgi:Tol biopolymer transport system component
MPASDAKKLPGIFISYRRSDSPDATGRIYDRLVSEFGKSHVFKDVDSIPLGQDFRSHLNEVIGVCSAVLAIIGPRWSETDNTGKPRLEYPDDFVRIELEAALARNVPVVPVLVGNAHLPAGADLPASLASMVYRQSIKVRPDPDFHHDATRLVSALKRIIDPDAPQDDPDPDAESRQVRRPRWITWLAVAATLAAIAFAMPAIRYLRQAPLPETRVDIVTPSTNAPGSFALSPDGSQIVFVASGDGGSRLWLRSLATNKARPLQGTDGARCPFWSPDSRSIGFFTDDSLKRLDLDGGRPKVLAPAGAAGNGTWSDDGVILFVQSAIKPIERVAATGGQVTQVVQLGPEHVTFYNPLLLPDGRRFLFSSAAGTAPGIYVGSLDGKPPVRLTPEPRSFDYLRSGWLLQVKAGVLVAQRLDLEKAVLVGEQETLAEGVGGLSTSTTGLIAFRGIAPHDIKLAWRDRSGAELGVVGDPGGRYDEPRVSPDGHQVAVVRSVQEKTDIWLLDGARSSRVTFNSAQSTIPAWSPDGTHIAYTAGDLGDGDLYQALANGAGKAELMFKSAGLKFPTSWSQDGRFLLYFVPEGGGGDIFVLPTGWHKPFPFRTSKFVERWGQFSPDGKWVAYQSDESGQNEVYVRAFVEPEEEGEAPVSDAGQWQMSTAGGVFPTWSGDGKELFFISPAGDMMAVPIAVSDSGLKAGTPVALFQTHIVGGGTDDVQGRHYDVARDGRFLINTVVEKESAPPITLIQNWNSDAGK